MPIKYLQTICQAAWIWQWSPTLMERKQLLAQTMAFLLCTTPETKLGKLLNFCLAAKVEAASSDKTPLEFAEELIANPEKLSHWIVDIIDSDGNYSVDEMIALSEMGSEDQQQFMNQLLAEVASLDTQGLSQ
jgi:hypothetical protein